MKLFKIIASRGGTVLFDDRLEASSPREARNQMRTLLGMKSLTGVVYSITEMPADLIGEIAEAKVAEALARFEAGSPPLSLQEIVRVAVGDEVRRQLADLRAQLAVQPPAGPETPPPRFDPFQASIAGPEPEPAAPPSPVVERVQANVEARRQRQSRGHPSVTTDGRTIDWRAVKKLYLQSRSLKQTAAAFDLSPNTVKARARKEGWAQ